ncbi:hypothetical protein BH24ACT16_BH24ACT16_03110 [soil metagenome]
MTPVKEKVARGRGITGESGLGVPRSREEAPGENREREGRRAGILLVVIGCVLMALAAGEAAASGTTAAGAIPAQLSTGLVL